MYVKKYKKCNVSARIVHMRLLLSSFLLSQEAYSFGPHFLAKGRKKTCSGRKHSYISQSEVIGSKHRTLPVFN